MGADPQFLFLPILVFHHPVSSGFACMAYILSLLFLLDVFSSPMWTDLTHVQDPYLRRLADKLPEVVLGARADNTTLTDLNGFKMALLGLQVSRDYCATGCTRLCCLVFA